VADPFVSTVAAGVDDDPRIGDVVADRFEIERAAGKGGMGVVFRARDRQSGDAVALKVLRFTGAEVLERFRREARVLAALRHPGIVRYVDDGRSANDELYIAMEWLEGEPLSARIARRASAPIGLRDAVALVRRVAEALGVAHANGIVHRDLKPANLFLRDKKLEGVAVLDFGLARLTNDEQALTRTEAVLGTPGYMSPEQAAGEKDVDARADVFALGCLLYELVTGVAPFRADTFVASLARVLLEDPPAVTQHAPHVPTELDALVTRMLAKDPAERPRDASAVVDALRAIEIPEDDASSPPPHVAARGLGEAERRVVSVVLARGLRGDAEAAAELSARHGARFHRLPDASLLAAFAGPNAVDQAERAAQVAAAIAASTNDARVAIATGMSELRRGAPLGEAIDRAAKLLDVSAADASARVKMDKITTRLTEARADPTSQLARSGEANFVGRARELALLEAVYDECVAEPIARAVLVVAPPGMGKSRLLGELVTRLGARTDAPEILVARPSAIGAGSSFATLAAMIRRASSIAPEDDLDAARTKLAARVAQVVTRHGGADAARVAEFLGEIAGVAFPAAPGSALQAARRDPALNGDQMRRAAEDWLAAECARRPLVLVLDDLQWGDTPTVRLIDAALTSLSRRPLMVLALARPEVRQTFPALWSERGLTEVSLGPLLPKASAQLVRARLGAAASDAVVDEIAASADGHPFLLDELARAAAGGQTRAHEGRPETAIAVAQAALERIEGDARRVLRAASVFGGAFRKEGIKELMGGEGLGNWLDELEARQMIRRATNDAEYIFRHDLLREAAYATLTEEDRTLAHGLAGRFLEAAGHTDAIALARHFAGGAMPTRAVFWYRRSAELALEGSDHSAVLERVKLAVSSGADGEELGRLSLLRAEAHKWRGENAEAEEHATDAMKRLRVGTAEWFRAAAEDAAAAGKMRHREPLIAIEEALLAADANLELDAARVAWARTALQFCYMGMLDHADRLLARIESAGGAAAAPPHAAGHIYETLAVRGDETARIRFGEQAIAAFEAAGDERNACNLRIVVSFGLNELGAFRRTMALLRTTLASAERLGLSNVQATACMQLGLATYCTGDLDAGEELVTRALVACRAQGNRLMEGAALSYLASIALARNDLATAERNAHAAVAVLGEMWMARAAVDATLARIRLAQGAKDEALTAACAGAAALAKSGERTTRKGLVRLALAEALHAAGRDDEAREALRDARDRLLSRASQLDDSLRADFLGAHPDHARTLRWSEEWLA
jgi:hypothetical protein